MIFCFTSNAIVTSIEMMTVTVKMYSIDSKKKSDYF